MLLIVFLPCHQDIQSKNLNQITPVTYNSRKHLELSILYRTIESCSNAIYHLLLAKAVFGFASGVKPICMVILIWKVYHISYYHLWSIRCCSASNFFTSVGCRLTMMVFLGMWTVLYSKLSKGIFNNLGYLWSILWSTAKGIMSPMVGH